MKIAKTIECKYCRQHKTRAHYMHYGAASETCVHCGHAKRNMVIELDLPIGHNIEPDGALRYLYNIAKGLGYGKEDKDCR